MFPIDSITLTHVRIPLIEPFRISSGAVAEKDAIAVELRSEGRSGWGESSPMAGSFYSSDTPESCWRDLTEGLAPALCGRRFDSLEAACAAVADIPASNFARTGVETALWDLQAQRRGQPLHRLLGGERDAVESGLAVGLYDDTADMLRVIERHLGEGYKRVKIKIEPGRDVELVRAVRDRFGSIPLFVDANCAYTLEHLAVFRQLDEFGLVMFEQPFPGGMLEELAELQAKVTTPVCLDESLESLAHLERAIALGSLRIANIKIQRVGGFGPSLAIYRRCLEHGIGVWIGTMPELGIGQAQAAALASLTGCGYPTDVESSARWFRDDLITPWIEVENGLIKMPAAAGFGYEIDRPALARYTVANRSFR
jgi:o-succinylbenzoate synthase